MAVLNQSILKDTVNLINLYNKDIRFKQAFDRLIVSKPRTTYKGRLLRVYAEVVYQAILDPQDKQLWKNIRKDPLVIKELFTKYKQPRYLKRLEKAVERINAEQIYSPEEIQQINQIEEVKTWPEKRDLYANFFDNKDKGEIKVSGAPIPAPPPIPLTEKEKIEVKEELKQSGEQTGKEVKYTEETHRAPETINATQAADRLQNIPQSPSPQIILPHQNVPQAKPPIPSTKPSISLPQLPKLPGIKIPSFIKDIGVKAEILASKALKRYGANIASGGIWAAVGTWTTGGNPLGTIVGGAFGSTIFPSIMRRGGGQLAESTISGLGTKGVAQVAGKAAVGAGGRLGLFAAGVGSGAATGGVGTAITIGATIVTNKRARQFVIALVATVLLVIFIPWFDGLTVSSANLSPIAEANNLTPIPTGPTTTPSPSPSGIPSSIASCSFTRSGNVSPFSSSTLLGWITDAANREGIPPAILASIARHESEYLTTQGNDDPEIKSNSFCNPGRTLCVKPDGSVLYRACTPEDGTGAKTARAMGLMQVMDMYYPNEDLCQITNNIRIGAQIFKSKLTGSLSNKNDVKKAVCRYFGVPDPDTVDCTYNGYNYGQEVWDDYQKCQSPMTTVTPLPTQGTAVCPINGGAVTCGPQGTNYSDPDCNNGGHCSGKYIQSNGSYNCTQFPATAFAVDIPSSANTEVLMPSITDPDTKNIYQLDCIYSGASNGSACSSDPSQCQIITAFQCQAIGTNKWSTVWIQFHHLIPDYESKYGIHINSKVKTGQVVGQVFKDHVHVQMGINGGCPSGLPNTPSEPNNATKYCRNADDYLQSQCTLSK